MEPHQNLAEDFSSFLVQIIPSLISCNPQSEYLVKRDLEFLILLHLPAKCWDYSYEPPHLAYAVPGTKLGIFKFIYLFHIPAAASNPPSMLPSQSLFPIPSFPLPKTLLLCLHQGKDRSPVSINKTWHNNQS